MTEEEIPRFFDKIFEHLANGKRLGYGLWGTTVLAWAVHAKYQRKNIHAEIERISEERNKHQGNNLGDGKISSSKE